MSNANFTSASFARSDERYVKVSSVHYSADFKNLYSRIDDFEKFYKMGKMSNDMIRYIPDLSQIAYQGQIHSTETKKNMLTAHTKTKKL